MLRDLGVDGAVNGSRPPILTKREKDVACCIEP